MSLTAEGDVATILIADPDPVSRRLLREHATAATSRALTFVESESIDAAAAPARIDAVLLDISRCGDPAAAVARAVRRAPVVALTASGSLSETVSAMRAGAADVLAKPVRPSALTRSLSGILAALPRSDAGDERPAAALAGCSAAMRGVQEQIGRIARSRAPVFVTGESGTGKELTAEAIHARSGRAGRFVAINCAAIPGELMESEIFGHVRGAFTGAHETRTGAAELSDGGTLFLDEICEMEPALQTKLLRFVQSGTLSRVGETAPRRVDVRIVCATNRVPKEEVASGRFREDLFYRLHVLPIHLPPLRDRPGDILPLARQFLREFAGEEDRGFTCFEPAAERLLTGYDWPGNVRQLQNVVRRAVVLNDGEAVSAPMIAMALAHAGAPESPISAAASRPAAVEPFRVQERRIIEQALETFDGNVGRAAAALQISPSTIYRKMQDWNAASTAA